MFSVTACGGVGKACVAMGMIATFVCFNDGGVVLVQPVQAIQMQAAAPEKGVEELRLSMKEPLAARKAILEKAGHTEKKLSPAERLARLRPPLLKETSW